MTNILHGVVFALAAFCVVPSALAQVPLAGADEVDGEAGDSSILLNADQIDYDDTLEFITARGNVELEYGGQVLRADLVTYNQREDLVTATGNVQLRDLDGTIYMSEYMELTDRLREGFIRKLRGLFADESRFSAAGAVIGRQGMRIDYTKGAFTRCRLCEDRPEKPPLWRIRADRIVHHRDRKQVEYTDATVDVLGVPVFYTPYFYHPDPTVKRQSGFLAPNFGNSKLLGGFFSLPYFWAISEDKDATIEPVVMGKENPLLISQYRQRFTRGRLQVDGSITSSDRTTGSPGNLRTESDKVRGHFFSNFDYHINQHWRFGSVFRRASDRTYLRQYSSLLSDPGDELLSQHNLQGFHGRNYSWLRILHYQDLRSERSAIGTPEILPEAGFEGLGDSDQLGGRWHISGLARNYRRNNDVDVMAGSIEAGYELPVTAPYGVTINFDTRLRTDYFSTDIHRRNDRFGQPRSDQNKVRAHPLVSMDMAWPFARFGQDSRQTITPRILAVAAPKGGNIVDIPATDSLGTNLNHANLFRTVRLAGIDRIETGQRIAYGLEGGHYWGNDRHLTALFGQSLSFAEDRTLKRENRFRKGRSDWFGRWNLVPDDWLEIEQNLSIDRHYERLNRVITSGQLTFDQVGPLDQVRTSLTHALYRDPLIEDAGSRRINQISWNGAVRINRFWQIDGSASHNLRSQNAQGQKQKRTLSYKARIVYEDDCLIFSSQFSRNLVNRSDLNEDYKLLFTITFKGLASFDNTL